MAGHVSPSTTATVYSRPGTNSSTSAWPAAPGRAFIAANAAASAPGHSSGRDTLEMPTELPSHGGFTTTGSGSGGFASPSDASDHGGVGTPFISSESFVFTLSIAMREVSAPGPV